MKILLFQLDGALPNLALMRLAAYHRALGDEVELRRGLNPARPMEYLSLSADRVYASCIFERTRPIAEFLRTMYPQVILGGTGVDGSTGNPPLSPTTTVNLEQMGIPEATDYSIYPEFPHSIGFTQRGCRLKCKFCVVPRKEGAVREVSTVADIWRGEPWPKHVLLLDNDFFGQANWRDRITEIREGGFKVCFSQGINARFLDDDAAKAIASVRYYDNKFATRRIYTAWDNRKDEARLFAGLERLASAGVRPEHIMVYMLIGYWNGPKLHADDFHRHQRLREFGCLPYPMPYARTRELVGFQRWIVGAYDKRVPWERWEAAGYQPRKLTPAHTAEGD